MTSCQDTRVELQAAFIEGRSILQGPLGEHLQGCAACQEVYHQLFEAQSLLTLDEDAGDPPGLSLTEVEMLREMVLPEHEPPRRESSARRWSWRRLLLPWAPLAAAATALVLFLTPVIDPFQHEFSSRSMTAPAPDAVSSPLGIRLLCLVGNGSETRVHSLAGPSEQPRCGAGDTLGFSFRNETDQSWHLQLVLGHEGTNLTTIFPALPDHGEGRVVPAEDEAPLAATHPLGQEDTGQLDIWAIFTDTPQDPARLRAMIAEHELSRLPADAQVVHLQTNIGDH